MDTGLSMPKMKNQTGLPAVNGASWRRPSENVDQQQEQANVSLGKLQQLVSSFPKQLKSGIIGKGGTVNDLSNMLRVSWRNQILN